ncbi:MAG: T9SS type A sorting domain-containing protein [Balneolaceae bacterium]
MNSYLRTVTRLSAFVALLIVFMPLHLYGQGQGLNNIIIEDAPEAHHICTFDNTGIDRVHSVRSELDQALRLNVNPTAEFNVSYVEACGGQDWPQQAINAFEFALEIWSFHIQSSVPIRIRASWTGLQGNVLGSAGPTRIVQITQGEPQTWYSIAQGSAMSGVDIVATIPDEEFDINVNMNCNFANWYLGTDANTPTGQIDFVTVVLHEIGHGLGFIGSMNANNDTQSANWGFGTGVAPIIYDRFIEDGNSVSVLNTNVYPNPSNELYNAVTGQRGGLFFNGVNANSVFAGNPIPIFTPDQWQGGSSYSHVDFATFTNTENALMRPSIDQATAVHSPGPVMCGMFLDAGWPLGPNCQALVGAEALILIDTAARNFGVTNVRTPLTETFEISNDISSEDPLSGQITVDGVQFNLASQSNFSIAPGASSTITVEYNPSVAAQHLGELLISHNGSNRPSPVRIRLSGESLSSGQALQLEQNFPNPFIPSQSPLRIPFVIAQDSRVKIELYDSMGRRVQTLLDETRTANRYLEEFNINGLAGGIYFYRVTVNGADEVRKAVVVR